jgi:hypothetical protein
MLPRKIQYVTVCLHAALTIVQYKGLYLAIIMDRYEGPNIALTIALHRGL